MKIGIIGGGKVGTTIATLLESCECCGAVLLGDVRADLKLVELEKTGGRPGVWQRANGAGWLS